MRNKMIGMAAATVASVMMASASWAADDAAFIQEAIQGSMAEVQMGELAQKNGASEEVRSLGEQLVTDHSASMKEASELAAQVRATVPNEPTAEAQQHFEQMQQMSGEEFDAAFAEHMVTNHEKEIQKFEDQSQSGSGEVAEFARVTLPTLQEHLETAQSIVKK
jgi:putative membrane protein